MIKKEIIGKGFSLSQKIKILFLIGTITLAATFVATIHFGTVSAQKNKTTVVQSQGLHTTTIKNTKVNIVLVHGAWADASSWSGVISILQKAGYKVIAVELPEHTLADDIATVKRAINVIGGPVILVGHSYGGEVITNAGYNNPNVKGLVYIAAFAPDEGQSIGKFVNPTKFPKGALIVDSKGFAYINPAGFHDLFAQDVDPAQTNIMAAVQKPFNLTIFSEKSGPPAWKHLSTWYQISENDHAIPPAIEHQFAKQMNATTISLSASHASYVSHPNEIAQFIIKAVKGVTK
jgi:pimeloyl-ACP methyl ester carboxylesterase